MSEKPEFSPDELPGQAEQQPAADTAPGSEQGGLLPEMPTAESEPHPEASLAPAEEAVIPETEETRAVRQPSRFQLFLRRALIWLGIVAAAFLAGFLTMYFVNYQPKVRALEQAEQQVASLQVDLESASQQLEVLTIADQQRALLSVLADAYDARLAMAADNTVAAKAALSSTDAALDEVIETIRNFDSGLADALPQRLDLIRTNIDRDIETAIQDCDQLIEDLEEANQAIFP